MRSKFNLYYLLFANFNTIAILLVALWVILAYLNIHKPPLPKLTERVQDFSEGWEYAWIEGEHFDADRLSWFPYKIGLDFPTREGKEFLLLRNRLPDLDFPNPAIFVSAIDQNFICYVGQEQIYSFGNFPMKKKSDFLGFFHYLIIPLQKHHSGKEILFKIHSKWVRIGMNQDTLIGRESELIFDRIQAYDGALLSLGVISLFLSLLFLIATVSLKSGDFFPYFGMYLFTSMILFSQSPLTAVFVHFPLFFTYLVDFSIAMVLLFLIQISRRFIRKEDDRILNYLTKIYSCIVIYLIVLTMYSAWDSKLQIFLDIPLYTSILFSDILIPILIIRNIKNLRRSQLSFIIGLSALIVGNIPQALFELGLSKSYPLFYFHLGVFVFILAIAFSAYDSLLSMYKEMEASQKNLQKLVSDRTRDIEEKQERILKLERNIVKKQTEESMLVDFHDQIGARLLDLKNLLLNRKNENINKDEILRHVGLIASGLKERINTYENQELTKQDFFTGLRVSIFQRYYLSKRRAIININISNSNSEIVFKDEVINLLHNIFTEIVNNDLKYGMADSISKFDLDFEKKTGILIVVFKAKTTYQDQGEGFGKKSLRLRVQDFGGTLEESIKESEYFLKIKIKDLMVV